MCLDDHCSISGNLNLFLSEKTSLKISIGWPRAYRGDQADLRLTEIRLPLPNCWYLETAPLYLATRLVREELEGACAFQISPCGVSLTSTGL